ncbi:hypothetical protein BB561_005765 [Smittium simulii]|uniref:CLASP N-terminal domain-containing protein n=1 Tax=Smittium simulii TaxID=133385 RepID=A0A2T9Y8E4_9FUNG|nr:hypothetical protein BB561_005765 [Smittium simulii]
MNPNSFSTSKTIDELTRSLFMASEIDKKLSILQSLNSILQAELPIALTSLEKILMTLAASINTSQTRVSSSALICIESLLFKSFATFESKFYKSILNFLVPPLIDRFSDVKLEIRSQAVYLLGLIWANIYNFLTQNSSIYSTPLFQTYQQLDTLPQTVPITKKNISRTQNPKPSDLLKQLNRELINSAFSNKNYRVREMTLQWIVQTNIDFPYFQPFEFLPSIINALFDSNDAIRSTSKYTLAFLYKNKPELQQEIMDELCQRKSLRSTIISEITMGTALIQNIKKPGTPISPYRDPFSSRGLTPSHLQNRRSSFSRVSNIDMNISSISKLNATRAPSSQANFTKKYENTLSSSVNIKQLSNRPQSQLQSQAYSQHQNKSRTQPFSLSGLKQSKNDLQLQHTDKKSFKFNSTQTNEDIANKPEPNIINQILMPPEIKPIIIDSQKFIEIELSLWSSFFTDKESEENWSQREKYIHHFRRLVWGNTPLDYPDAFILEVKKQRSNITKTLISLRTSLSISTIKLFEEIVFRLGSNANSVFNFIFESLVSLCSTTKKLVYQAALKSLSTVVSVVPISEYSLKIILNNISSKSILLRQSSINICLSMVQTRSNDLNPSHEKIFSLISQIVSKGISDFNPGIRSESKELYTLVLDSNGVLADRIIKLLDPKHANQLTKPNISNYITQSPLKIIASSNNKTPIKSNLNVSISGTSDPGHLRTDPFLLSNKDKNGAPEVFKLSNSTYKASSGVQTLKKGHFADNYNSNSSSANNPFFTNQNNTSNPLKPFNSFNRRNQSDSLTQNITAKYSTASSNYKNTTTKSLENDMFKTNYNKHRNIIVSDNSEYDYQSSVDINNLPSFSSIKTTNPFLENLIPARTSSKLTLNEKSNIPDISSIFDTLLINDDKSLDNRSEISDGSKSSKKLTNNQIYYTQEFIFESKIYEMFGINEISDKSELDTIEKYLKISSIIEPLSKNLQNMDKFITLKHFDYQERNFKILSRFIKDHQYLWLWKLSKLPCVIYNPSENTKEIHSKELLYLDESTSLFQKFSFAITYLLRLPLNNSNGFMETFSFLDLSRLLIRRRSTFLKSISDINQMFWELLRLREYNDSTISGLADASLNQIMVSVDKHSVIGLFLDILQRCPLPELDNFEDFTNYLSSNVNYKPSQNTSQIEDPYNTLKSARVLSYSIELLTYFISGMQDSSILSAYIAQLTYFLVKAIYHQRNSVVNSGVSAIMCLKNIINIPNSLFSQILQSSSISISNSGVFDINSFIRNSKKKLSETYSELNESALSFCSYVVLLDDNHRKLISLINNQER